MENIPLTKQATKKKLRQFLSIALAFTTTVSLSGFALLFAVTASAAVTPLSDGDLVRGPDGIKVYIVKPAPHGTYAGWKRHIFNPAVFNMYGHLKWENIQSINQETVDAYQTSDLYKELNDPKVYSLEESGSSAAKHWIENEAAFLANGYSWSQIFTVNEAERDYYVSGSPITTTVVTPPVTPPVTPAAGTGLTVSWASNTPAAGSIVADTTSAYGAQAMASMLTANFAAGSDGDVAVTTLKVTRKGISADADLANAYLYEGDTRIAEMLNIGSNVITFSNTAGLFMVSKGTSKAITVKIDVTNGTSAGKTIALAINAASDVTAGSATISGSYPITGNYMTTAGVGDLGKVTVTNVAPTGATTVDPGQIGYEVWRFSVAATNQKVKVSKIKVTNIGSIATTDLTNIKLMDAATQLGSTATSLGVDGSVTFDMSANPLTVLAGQTKNLSVMADIIGGTTRTFRFTIQRSADVVAMDDNYGIYLKPNQTDSFVVVTANSATTATTINSGTLTVSVDPASPNGNVALDYTDQEMARFQFKASGEAVKVTSLTATSSGGTAGGINNAKLYLDGTQVGSTADLAAGANTTFNFGNSFVIPAGATKIVVVKGEVKKADATSFSDGNTVKVNLVAGSSNAQGQTSLSNISTSAANGNVLTVRSGTLTLGVNSGLANAAVGTPTGVKGAVGTKIASFTLTAGSGEAVTVTQIVMKNNATAGQGLGSDFQNLTLKNGATQLGTTIGSLSTTASNTYTFTPSPSISVAAGQQYVVDVYADSLTGATNTTVAYSAVLLDSVTATGQSTNSSAGSTSAQTGQQIYIATSGTLALAAASDMPIAQLRSMGQTGQTLATFKLTAGPQEGISVTKVIVTDTISGTSAAATGSITNLKLFKSNGTQVGTTVTSMTSSSTGLNVLATFTGISNLTVAKDGTEVLTLKGDVNGYPNAVSGSAHTFQIISASDVTALGALSGQGPSVSGAPAGTAQTVYRSELSIANAMSNMTGGASAAQQVGKYTFTNTSAGNYTITVTDLDLNISSTLSAGTGTVVIKKDSPSGTTLATKTFTTASLANVTSWDATFTSFTIDAANGTGSVDIYVLVDTASFTPAGAKTISTSIGATGVVWGEVVSTSIANIDGAPIYGATVTY